MPHCVVYGCNNPVKNKKDMSFYVFPKDKQQMKAWTNAIGRTSLKDPRVCSQHFTMVVLG